MILFVVACASALVLALAGCESGGGGAGEDLPFDENAPNPFLEDQTNASKEDTQYVNPNGIEVEVDLEGYVEAPSYRMGEAPAVLGQFAVTYLRKRGEFYLESLAEDATSRDRVEWLVDGEWLSAEAARAVEGAVLSRFRIRGVNAVLLHGAVNDAYEGREYLARVPIRPYDIMKDAGKDCADEDSHMPLGSSVYWYLWNPDRSGCKTELTQDLLVTVSRMLPSGRVTYPEYDQLVADGKVTAVVLFGKIGDGPIEDDYGMRSMEQMARWLGQAGYEEIADPPVGRRFSRRYGEVTLEIDLYSPKDFSGLSDRGNYANFERAVTEHEVVAYDGHSMLGASDFWARPKYPDFYQIFLYGGCLGYEYYVRPILEGKGGWDKVDIVSSVIEVSADANRYAGPFFAKLAFAVEHGYNVSWKDLLVAIRARVGDATFGVSGARENCFSPAGSRCGPDAPQPGETRRYVSEDEAAIPDDDPTGVTLTLEVAETEAILGLTLELNVTHTYIGDLLITLAHDGKTATVWEKAGGRADGLSERLALSDFDGQAAAGTWTLHVVDTAKVDTGTVESWALEILYPRPQGE